ncbi:hypothetical protein M083_4876, partial [Bacteroides fragilis str. 3986 T(B)9]
MIVGGLWMHLNEGSTPMDKYIEITAQKSRMY